MEMDTTLPGAFESEALDLTREDLAMPGSLPSLCDSTEFNVGLPLGRDRFETRESIDALSMIRVLHAQP